MRIVKISSCKDCPNLFSLFTKHKVYGQLCNHEHLGEDRDLENYPMIPDWCPLEEAGNATT